MQHLRQGRRKRRKLSIWNWFVKSQRGMLKSGTSMADLSTDYKALNDEDRLDLLPLEDPAAAAYGAAAALASAMASLPAGCSALAVTPLELEQRQLMQEQTPLQLGDGRYCVSAAHLQEASQNISGASELWKSFIAMPRGCPTDCCRGDPHSSTTAFVPGSCSAIQCLHMRYQSSNPDNVRSHRGAP